MPPLMRGVLLGLGCALAGAAVWAGVSLATDMRLGFLAIVVGGLAGFGVSYGSRGRGGAGAGVLAALVALVAITAARGVVANVYASRMVAENMGSAEQTAIEQIASEVYDQYQAGGVQMTETEEGWPPEVIAAAHKKWNALSAVEQQERLKAMQTELDHAGAAATGALTLVGMVLDFGLFGFVFTGLALGTAYKTGSTRAVKTEQGWQVVDDDTPAPVVAASAPTTESAAVLAPRGFPSGPMTQDEDPLERLKRLRAQSAVAKTGNEGEQKAEAA